MKPDKGQGIVLFNKSDYCNSFSNKLTFEVVDDDLTSPNPSTVQNYFNLLFSQGEITKEQRKKMLPKFYQTGRTHDLPNTHTDFDKLLSFRQIVDTTNTPGYRIDLFLAKLLNPLTQNEYSVKDFLSQS